MKRIWPIRRSTRPPTAGTKKDNHNVYGLARGIDGKHIIAYNFSQIMSEQLPDILSGLRKALEKEPYE
ncbi:MAG: hypothetical protein C4B58_15790 [Deltaproteobacteria bacterium]|nr:MAG: hypothetical protein C4B58_15790 [Deltaproteobacteria bacterium]